MLRKVYRGLNMFLFALVLDILLWDTTVLGRCQIKCGVIDVLRDGSRLPDLVADVYIRLQSTGHVFPEQVTFTFQRLPMRSDLDWDTLNQAYLELVKSNISAIIGPYSKPLVTSSERVDIPYFLVDAEISPDNRAANLITVFPSRREINTICVQIIAEYRWRDVLIFYDDEAGVRLIEELLGLPALRVRAKRLEADTTPAQVRAFLLEMRHILVTNYVIAANKTWTTSILNEALFVSMLSSRHSWILLSFDLSYSDIEPFSYTDVNLTVLDMGQGDLALRESHPHSSLLDRVIVEDSILTLYHMLVSWLQDRGTCSTPPTGGLLDALQQINTNGATGTLQFSKTGRRNGYVVKIMNLVMDSLYQSGQWNASAADTQLSLKPAFPDNTTSHEFPLGKQVVNVVTIIEPPFLQEREGHEYYEGNEKYEGFCMDLLSLIAEKMGFQYKVQLVPSGPFGSVDSEGNWNGLIGEILNGHASLAVSSLTITSQREQVVDFAKPYKPRGLSIVMKKTKLAVSYFQFLEPLSLNVWALMGVTLCVVSLCIYLVDRIAPPDEPARPLNPHECIWFTFASLVLNGTDIVPRTISSRILAGSLWLFSLIIISSYTANLAAFLTISKFDSPIHSVYDLNDQDKVTYGTVWSSATSDFFQFNQISYFKEMWQRMAVSNPSSMVNSTDEGFQRVRNSSGDYAFIWDDDVILYETNKDCDLRKVGNVFDTSKGYGIAMAKGASYRDTISMAVLELGEDGTLAQLQHKWWKPPICPGESNPTGNRRKSLAISGVAGVFIVLTTGMVLALFAAVTECMWKQIVQRNRKLSEHQIPLDSQTR